MGRISVVFSVKLFFYERNENKKILNNESKNMSNIFVSNKSEKTILISVLGPQFNL